MHFIIKKILKVSLLKCCSYYSPGNMYTSVYICSHMHVHMRMYAHVRAHTHTHTHTHTHQFQTEVELMEQVDGCILINVLSI
jgi:hypothetical protein